MIPLPDQVTRSYVALAAGDRETARRHCVDDVTCHIGGAHPFTGDYRGVSRISDVLRRMQEVGGEHSFSVTNVMSDDSGSQVLIEGVADNAGFVRHVMTRLRFEDGRLAELWVKPLDQRAEDEFWRARVPLQRSGGTRAGTEVGNGR